jgi:predicted GH43/DUF377 family glycosyl hydrolase
MPPIPVTRTDVCYLSDPKRVITKPFIPGDDISADGRSRILRILSRILALDESIVVATVHSIYERFTTRHVDLTSTLESHFAIVAHHIELPASLSVERRRLIGAYFTHEYSIESAALSNPSIVPAPRQDGMGPNEVRFIMSLRAIGEGHLSSIEFRSGVVNTKGHFSPDPVTRFANTARHRTPMYDKGIFLTKLMELGSSSETSSKVLDALPDHFTIKQLDSELRAIEEADRDNPEVFHATRSIHWLASSNYESTFDADSNLSERVLFPAGPPESHGMEDARFVRFTHDDGDVTYFATYTAFDGSRVLPQLIETRDFVSFRIGTLNGHAARNKGMALFPRKIGGRFVALARLDNENNHVIRSDNVHFWHESQILQMPEESWELVQLGNSGSPIETDAGWLVITHGVGPLRQYYLGAILLDLNDPTQVIGRLREPFLAPALDEGDGYVPNVVYSCGSMLFGDLLILPYGFSDVGARIATLSLSDLLAELTRPGSN